LKKIYPILLPPPFYFPLLVPILRKESKKINRYPSDFPLIIFPIKILSQVLNEVKQEFFFRTRYGKIIFFYLIKVFENLRKQSRTIVKKISIIKFYKLPNYS